jgi:hypothetical protein
MATTAHTDVVSPARRPGAFFSFPDPVNEVSARLVAGGVMIMSIASLIVDEHAEWLLF